jgi:hypothetical protein
VTAVMERHMAAERTQRELPGETNNIPGNEWIGNLRPHVKANSTRNHHRQHHQTEHHTPHHRQGEFLPKSRVDPGFRDHDCINARAFPTKKSARRHRK